MRRPGARKPPASCPSRGHLREAHLSAAVAQRQVEVLAFDQDAQSLAVVNGLFGGNGVRTVQGRVRDVIAGRHLGALGTFDLVYAAGLYDYLTDTVARRLTRRLFELLNPGGVLLVANFLPGLPDVGYMETYMGWDLIYRSQAEIASFAAEIAPERIAASRVYEEENGAVGFLELRAS